MMYDKHVCRSIVWIDPFSCIHKVQSHINNFGYNIPSLCTRRFYLKIKLFPDALQDSEIKILTNQRNFVDFGSSVKKSQIGCIANCQGYYLEKEIVNEAKSIIKLNSEGTEKSCTEILNVFIEQFNTVEKQMEEIKKMLNALNTRSEIDSISSSSNFPVLNGSYKS